MDMREKQQSIKDRLQKIGRLRLPEIAPRTSQRVNTDSEISPNNLSRFTTGIIDSGDSKPKLFTGKRKTEFNIYDSRDPTLFETSDPTRDKQSSLASPNNVRRGLSSLLDRQNKGRNSTKLATEVITRLNVPSNIVTRESQAVSIELKEARNDFEMSKKKSLSQFSGHKHKKSSYKKTDRQIKDEKIRCLITNPSLNLLSPEEYNESDVKQGSDSKKRII